MATVTVLGGGVSGLTTGIRLREAGHDVDVIAREYLIGTTSWVATAIWHLFWVEVDDRVEKWAAASLGELLRLAERPDVGVTLVRGFECIREGTEEAIDFASGATGALWKAVVPSFAPLTKADLVSRLPDGYPAETLVGGYEVEVPIADMSVYLPYLMGRLEGLGASLQQGEVNSFRELVEKCPCDVVVNCAGLGARELTGDRQLKGVKGQVVRVSGTRVESYIADDYSPEGMTYILPRHNDVILGGTQQLGVEDSNVDPAVGEGILARCSRIDPTLSRATVHEHMAGVRPYRKNIRLEAERRDGTVVIHNYGHGGSGVSLSWGCADSVVEVLSSVVNNSQSVDELQTRTARPYNPA